MLLCINPDLAPLRRHTVLNWRIRLPHIFSACIPFFCAGPHFTMYFWRGWYFDPAGLIEHMIKCPFITVGFLAFTLMIPLAIILTSHMLK